jgi:two-component system, LytTR family, sensor kinase
MKVKGSNINSVLHSIFGFENSNSRKNKWLIFSIHFLGWLLLFGLPFLFYPFRISDSRFFVSQLIDKFFLIGFFYFNYYFLIPRLFIIGKRKEYFLAVIFCFLIYIGQYLYIGSQFFPNPGNNAALVPRFSLPKLSKEDSVKFLQLRQKMAEIDTIMKPPRPVGFGEADNTILNIPRPLLMRVLGNGASSFFLLFLLGGFIRLAYSYFKNQNEKKLLENANLNAEVNFLKAQINPHFLFNTLNGIYSQAHEKSEHTEHTVLKLSELLRYVLYDSGEDKVDLQKDLRYISNYVDLQKMRLSSKVTVNYSISGDPAALTIAPLLLTAFIENAFKHGVSYSMSSVIDIRIIIFEKTLTLTVTNPLIQSDSFVTGGLGLRNVKRRLELLYPGKHQLDISSNDRLYSVHLTINLENDQLFTHR